MATLIRPRFSSWAVRATAMGLLVGSPFLSAAHRAAPADRTAYFAGGCFWGVEWTFEHLRGVKSVVSGFASPQPGTRHDTGAETVRVVYDPSQVSYADLLRVFFLVAHDPTEVDKQGPDEGEEYRSLVFVADAAERQAARAVMDSLRQAHTFTAPIATEVATLKGFQEAPAAHQDFVAHHPNDAYVVINDRPKLGNLQRLFPALYRAETTEGR